jgi:ribosomal protein L4
VRTILAQNLNVFDVLEADMVVLTREALTQVEAQLA